MAIAPENATAANARVRWLPSSSQVSTYRVYVRNAGVPYSSSAWSGNPAPSADGSITAVVPFTPGPSGVNYFAVVAIGSISGVESNLSQELPIGTPNPCTLDACSAKTTCTFGTRPNGTSCADELFCNGDEVCQAGVCGSNARNCADVVECTVDTCDEAANKCVHTGPPGCCVACDSGDPCLADACAGGDCSAPDGTEIEVNRVRLLKKSSGIKLAAKGRFTLDAPVDPTVTGVQISLVAADGTELYTSTIPSSEVRAGSAPGRYRFVASRAQASPAENGATRLDFRVKAGSWGMTFKAETANLDDAFEEASLTWVVRMGSSCARHLYMECKQGPSKSTCR